MTRKNSQGITAKSWDKAVKTWNKEDFGISSTSTAREDAKQTHTPTPWHRLLAPLQIVTDTRIIATVNQEGLESHEGYANAELIVRAVNSHEELVALLKELRDCTLTDSGTRTQMTLRVEQAIAKAEGH